MTFVLTVLAIFFAWEALLMISPWDIPARLQPLLCYAGALAYVWPDWRLALAVCGAVTILHIVIVQRDVLSSGATPRLIARPSRRGNLPELP